MNLPFYLEFSLLLLLIVLNGLFSMSEIAIISSRPQRLQEKAARGNKRAQAVLDLMEHPNRFLSTVQIGITLIGILSGAFGGVRLRGKIAEWLSTIPIIGDYSQGISFWIVVLLISYLSLVIGELVPKHLGLSRTEGIALWVAPPMKWLSTAVSPVVWFLSKSTDLFVSILRLKPVEEPPVTEEEVKILMSQGTEAGVFVQEEHELVRSVFRFADKRVTSMMTPRSEIVWLDIHDSMETIQEKISGKGYSRFPVCDGDLDKVIGTIGIKDFWHRQIQNQPINLQEMAKKPLFAVEHISGFQLHKMFKESGIHTALVIDEYGIIKGLVTLVDMMTAILGEIPEEERPAEALASKQENGGWLIDAMISFHDLLEFIQLELNPEDAEEEHQILAGFVLAKLDEFPKEGSTFDYNGFRFTVTRMDHNRVDQVEILPLPKVSEQIQPDDSKVSEA